MNNLFSEGINPVEIFPEKRLIVANTIANYSS